MANRTQTSRRVALLAGLLLATVQGTPVVAAPGDLDPTFGSGGIVTTPVSHGAVVMALLQQPDAKLVAAGVAGSGIGLARYLADGSLDPTFGSGGTVTTYITFMDNNAALAVVRQPDGKLVVGGYTHIVTEFTSVQVLALLRYDENGSLDPTFGSGGVVTSANMADASAVVLQPDGKIVAGGSFFGSFMLMRVNPDGSLDPTFGAGGFASAGFGGLGEDLRGLVLQPDGKLVGAGQVNPAVNQGDFALARFNPDGSLDPTFGTGGRVVTSLTVSFDQASALVLQPDGKLVAAGWAPEGASQLPRDFAVVRYDTAGNPDGTFGIGGIVTTDIGVNDDGTAAVRQPDGRLVVAGTVDNGHIGLARYHADGSPDGTFGSGGTVFTNLITTLGTTGAVYALARQSDGKLVVGGSAAISGSDAFMLARYLGDCASTPLDGCRTAQKTAFRLKDNPDGNTDQMIWNWRKGQATSLADLGMPTGTTAYTLCVYAGTATAAYAVPGGPSWEALGTTGFKYKDQSGSADGIQRVILKSGGDGRTKAMVGGKGFNLPNPTLPLALPVTAQLVNSSNSVCYTASFAAAKKDTPTLFKAKSP